MPRICHNIHGVQVFHLLWCGVISHYLQWPNSPFAYFRFGTLSTLAFRVLSSSLPLFSVISIASRYTFVSFCVTIHSNLQLCFSYLLLRSIQANPSYILLRYVIQGLSFCPDFGKLVFAVSLWLSFSTLHELGYMHPFCSFPLQSRETEISD